MNVSETPPLTEKAPEFTIRTRTGLGKTDGLDACISPVSNSSVEAIPPRWLYLKMGL